MKVALVYDRINKWGGAETVLLALHEIWPTAPLFTSVYDSRRALWAKNIDIRPSFLQRLPLPKDRHEYYPFLMGIAFESFNFDDYDVVISVTHEYAKAIITKPTTLHLCYCLNPTGYLWENANDYLAGKSSLFKTLAKPVLRYLQWYDKIAAARPDKFIAISKAVGGRIEKYYSRDSEVIYPPVTLAAAKLATKSADYFLIVSRLVPNKRIDLAVTAFNSLGLPLRIVGTGSEAGRLKRLAKDNIEFVGLVSDDELKNHYAHCRALIVPGKEDFGIVSVEAQSYGKPVIAFGEGGATETIIDGQTGFLFNPQTASALIKTVEKVDLSQILREDCIANAARFSKIRFQTEFKSLVESLWKESRK